MPELKWDELDFMQCLEVEPQVEEYKVDLLQKSPTIAMLAGLTPSSNLWAKRKPRLEEGVSPAH